MRSLRRRTGEAVGLLFVFGFAVLRPSRFWPPKWMLRRIAASAEVRAERESAAEKLLARVREIEAGVPWLRALDVVIRDECVDVRGHHISLFEASTSTRESMTCRMSAFIVFSPERDPEDAVAEIRRTFPPPDGLSPGGISESLHWDTDERKVAVEGAHDALWARLTRRHGEKSLGQLRQENGALCVWALRGQPYFTVV
ncbi:hypothetical protein AB0900_03370 [Streptomyces cellulosae]|uniref:Uncharacterized protein n=2 Tax=Streptomyces TaxID=1883 RepID=A0ABU3J521_9ACTN|nr:hypothetical protein [Streptomyces thermodiastaticus]MDT6969143.1 hypothetical protein [Streptomyces thermocarboxydus]WSB43372.1 hypothetical protein OG853_22085 [Streptomyces cellulosae]UVT11620.1 hypothetical protein AY578_21545 [Streptomyces thermocarboxydus]WSB93153.1 hypothetical protein OG805_22485 [Streptomyces cellulosae]